jgi:hypothetical protein
VLLLSKSGVKTILHLYFVLRGFMRLLSVLNYVFLLVLLAACNVERPSISSTSPIPLETEEDTEISTMFENLEEGPAERWLNVQGDSHSNLLSSSRAHLEGAWSQTFDWPLIAIHAALLPDGKVFSFGTKPKNLFDGSNAFYRSIWDPAQGLSLAAHSTLENAGNTNIFCGAQTLLVNGTIMIAGGDVNDKSGYVAAEGKMNNAGVGDLNLYNPATDEFTPSPLQMTRGRWYPTMTTLSNGDVLVHGGIDSLRMVNDTPEVYRAGQGWRVLTGATSPIRYRTDWYYPWSFVAPNGEVFVAGRGPIMWYVNTTGNGSVRQAGRRDYILRTQGSAVMYNEGKILVVGGGVSLPTASAVTIDINGTTPIVTPVASMSVGRKYLNATVLPDGQVFVSGGSSGETSSLDTAVYHGEIWNPKTNAWQSTARASRPRMYHSTALLLPDGTILVTAGDRPLQARNFNAEIFFPPYLFKRDGSGTLADRPKISSVVAPKYNNVFAATLEGTPAISRVTLVRFGSTTHAWDMDQRFLELNFSQTGSTLSIQAPKRPELAPPGHYMLFAFDQAGVPSRAAIVKLTN